MAFILLFLGDPRFLIPDPPFFFFFHLLPLFETFDKFSTTLRSPSTDWVNDGTNWAGNRYTDGRMHKKNMEIPDKKGIIEIGGRVGIPRKTSFDLIIEEEGVKRRTGFFTSLTCLFAYPPGLRRRLRCGVFLDILSGIGRVRIG